MGLYSQTGYFAPFADQAAASKLLFFIGYRANSLVHQTGSLTLANRELNRSNKELNRPDGNSKIIRQTRLLHFGQRYSEGVRRSKQADVVAGQLDGLTLPADEIDRREMKCVEGAHRNRKGLQRASQDRCGKFEQPNSPDQHLR